MICFVVGEVRSAMGPRRLKELGVEEFNLGSGLNLENTAPLEPFTIVHPWIV